jgi:hypothetical protein
MSAYGPKTSTGDVCSHVSASDDERTCRGLSRLNAADAAAVSRASAQPSVSIRGASKIPPPMPVTPATNPILAPAISEGRIGGVFSFALVDDLRAERAIAKLQREAERPRRGDIQLAKDAWLRRTEQGTPRTANKYTLRGLSNLAFANRTTDNVDTSRFKVRAVVLMTSASNPTKPISAM